MKPFYKSPLTIYIVWHPKNELGIKYADDLYNYFCRDTLSPLTRGLGIPVRFRYIAPPGKKTPLEIDTDASDRNAIVLLIDDKMFLDNDWYDYVQYLLDKESEKTRAFPVALSSNAFNLDEKRLNKKQFINLAVVQNADKEKEFVLKQEELKGRLLHDLCRMFLNLEKVADSDDQVTAAPVKIFISHAKIDGQQLASEFRNYIQTNTKLKTFFDANDIEDAGDFAKAIMKNLESCAIVVFLSDEYSSREWCRIEVLVAKRNKSPIVVVNNLKVGEKRSFPYLGNTPTLMYRPDCFDDIVNLALFQVLNNLYLDEKLKKEIDLYDLNVNYRTLCIKNAPELFNYIDIKRLQNEEDPRKILVIYPEPPLGTEELKVLNDLDPNIKFITPSFIHTL